MTIKQILGTFNINNSQIVRITDETKKRTYESDPGSYYFRGCSDLFDGDFEAFLTYVLSMKVLYFSADSEMIWIHAEGKR